MMRVARIPFPNGGAAAALEVETPADLPAALRRLGLQLPRSALVSVGGAGQMSDEHMERLRVLFNNVLGPLAAAYDLAVVDGGTDAGVMRLAGQARRSVAAKFDLVGVAAVGTVRVPGRVQQPPEGADLEPQHSHFVLVPGTTWGAEAPWIARVATVIAADQPSVTLLSNGGEIAWQDVAESVSAGRPVVVVAGSGRTADVLASVANGNGGDARAEALVASGLIRVADPAQSLRQVARVLADALQLPAEEVIARLGL